MALVGAVSFVITFLTTLQGTADGSVFGYGFFPGIVALLTWSIATSIATIARWTTCRPVHRYVGALSGGLAPSPKYSPVTERIVRITEVVQVLARWSDCADTTGVEGSSPLSRPGTRHSVSVSLDARALLQWAASKTAARSGQMRTRFAARLPDRADGGESQP